MSLLYFPSQASSAAGGALTFVSNTTLSSDSSAVFTLDSTYKLVVFELIEVTVSADNTNLEIDVSVDAGTNYTVPLTSAAFYAENRGSSLTGVLAYDDSDDATDSTTGATIVLATDTASSLTGACISGHVAIYRPAGSSYKKIYTTCGNDNIQSSVARFTNYTTWMTAKSTSAIDRFRFKTSANNMTAGNIVMYGVKDS